MFKKLFLFLFFLIILYFPTSILARQKIQGIAEKGGKNVQVTSTLSYKLVESFPNCTITVYISGTLTLATIYSDVGGTSKANPFTANSDASFSFFADNGLYDVRFSGTGISSPFTLSAISASDPEDFYNVKNFGAKCDWNGTSGTLDTTAILAARTAAGIGGRVYFPRGLCLVDARIPMLSGQTFEGISSNASGISGLIQSSGTGTIFIGGNLREVVVQNLYLGTTSATQLSNSIGIEMASNYPNTTFHVTIRNIFAENFDKGGSIIDSDSGDETPDWQIENVSIDHFDVGESNYGLVVDSRNADLLHVTNSHYSTIIAGFYGIRTGNTILTNVTTVNSGIGYRFTGLADSILLKGLAPENNTDDLIIDSPGNYLPSIRIEGSYLYKTKIKADFIIHSEDSVYQEFKADYTNDVFIFGDNDKFLDVGLNICSLPTSTCWYQTTGNSVVRFATSKTSVEISNPTNMIADFNGDATLAIGRRNAGTGYSLSGHSSLIETYATGDKNVLNLFTRESPSSFTAAKWAIGIGSDGSFIFQDQTSTAKTPLTISPLQLFTFAGNANIVPLTGNPLLGIGTSNVGSGASNIGAAIDVKSSGDKIPYILIDGSGRSSFTNRKWSFLVGVDGDLQFYDVTGTSTRTKVDTSGNLIHIGNAIFGVNSAPMANVTLDIRSNVTQLSLYDVTGAAGFKFKRNTLTGGLELSGNQANNRYFDVQVPLQLTPSVDSKPTCSSLIPFRLWTTAGGSGVADKVEICVKDATDTYLWKTIL